MARAQGVEAEGVRELKKLVVELGSDEFEARESATRALGREGAPWRLRDLEELLRGSDLGVEARRRLMVAAEERFAREPRAALGVTSSPMETHGIVLQSVRADFPAAGVLQAGDRVEALDGVKMDGFESLRAVVVAHDPGDEIEVQLSRAGQLVKTRVRLGEYGGEGFAPLEQLLGPAWSYRSREYRRKESTGEAVRVSFAPESWRGVVDEGLGQLPRIDEGEPIPVVVGGEARRAGDVRGAARGDAEELVIGDRVLRRPVQMPAEVRQLQLQGMQQLIDQTRAEIRRLTQLRNQAGLGAAERDMLDRRLAAANQMLTLQLENQRQIERLPGMRLVPGR